MGSQHGGDILKNNYLGIQKEKQLMREQMIIISRYAELEFPLGYLGDV